MGQRLNIEISVGKDATLANSYYHWSGYTSSALQMTAFLIKMVGKIESEDKDAFKNNPCQCAIHLLELTGAGLTEDEYSAAKEEFPNDTFQKAKDRNEGLIAFTDKGIDETRSWEEARVTIDVVNHTVNFDVFCFYTSIEEYKEMMCCDEDDEEINPTKLNVDISNISFDKFEEFATTIMEGGYSFETPDHTILTVIE